MNGIDVLAIMLFLATALVWLQEPTPADDRDRLAEIEDEREASYYGDESPYDQELDDDDDA